MHYPPEQCDGTTKKDLANKWLWADANGECSLKSWNIHFASREESCSDKEKSPEKWPWENRASPPRGGKGILGGMGGPEPEHPGDVVGRVTDTRRKERGSKRHFLLDKRHYIIKQCFIFFRIVMSNYYFNSANKVNNRLTWLFPNH